jgi:cytochrome c oxidase assembly factor CtaG
MTLATGLVAIAAMVVLAAAEIRSARLGSERPSRRELLLLGVVFLVGCSAAAIRLFIALRG